MLLEHHCSVKPHQRYIVLKISRRIIRMHFLAFNAELFMIQSLILVANIPFAQPNLQIRVWRCGYTMGCRDNPTVWDQRTTTAQFTRQKPRFYKCHLPGMSCKAGRMPAYYSIGSSVQFAATCNGIKNIRIFNTISGLENIKLYNTLRRKQ